VKLTKELLEALSHLDAAPLRGGAKQVNVATAQPLLPAESQQLAQWVAASVGAEIPVQVTTDASLVAGCVVRIGDVVVDISLVNRLHER
jgi:F-type H+-transporting ATPase subunit delta